MSDPNVVAKATATEKVAEHALKAKANVNWLFVAGVAVVANVVGVIFHV